ncbi:MAG: gliding motility-associated C-terminal domain-containing protein, partial [Bacteroidota bacterium]
DILCPIELDGADAIVITVDSMKNVDCFAGNDGNIFISVTGGQPMYNFQWFNGAGMMFSNAEDLVGLIAGNYTPVVTDANGCTATLASPIQISEPDQLTVSVMIEDVSQAGSDGEIALDVNGGTPGYSYTWASTTGDPLPGINPLTGLNSGSYDVTITDANGCTLVESNIVLEGDIAIQANLTDPTCAGSNDGQILITPINAGGLVTYTWTTTDGSGLVEGAQNQLSLTAGTYFLTIEDANGSIASDVFVLTDPPPIVVTNVDINNESGSGCNGSINITVEGGTGSYTYEWSNWESCQDFTDLCKGQYSVIIKDENNCILVAGEYSVTAGPLLPGTITQENVTCNGGSDGSISLDVLGGCPVYTFDIGIDPKINSEEGEATFSGLPAGAYALTITDAANSTPIIYNFTITEPNPIEVTVNQLVNNTDPVNCNGSININVIGGNGDYDYEWSTGEISQDITDVCDGNGEISVVVTDSDGCTASLGGLFIELGLTASLQATNVTCMDEQDGSILTTVDGGTAPYTYTWSNNQTDPDIFGLEPGTYTVTIEDASNNTVVESATISSPSSAITINAEVTQPVGSNANGSIELAVTGGWSGYSYSWTGPDGPISGGTLLAGLTSGTYTVIVTDANGCEESMSYSLFGGELMIQVNTTGAGSCIGDVGTADAIVEGGTGQYTYLWSNGFNTNIIGGLTPGVYSVTVTDSNGLTGTGAGQVASFATLTVNLEVEDVTGSILAIANGGNAPYTYLWNNDNNDTTPEIVNQASGDYAVVVTDADGCTAVGQGTITSGTCDKVRRVISPNGDSRNDEFIVACAQRFDVRLEVFNRWGQLVFTMDNYDNSWEGTDQSGAPLPEDGYFYILEFTNSEGQEEQIKGALTLVR